MEAISSLATGKSLNGTRATQHAASHQATRRESFIVLRSASALASHRCPAEEDDGEAIPRSATQLVTTVTGREVDDELATRMTALRPALTRFFLRSGQNRADVEDMIQDVFLRIVRRGEMETYEGFASYAFLTASSVLKDHNRRGVVRHLGQHDVLDPETQSTDAPGQDREVIARDTLRLTSVVLAQLPERTRAVFVLRRLDGLSFAEISMRLGVSVSSAEKHMLKATRHLLAAMREAS